METLFDVLIILAILTLLSYFILGRKRKKAIASPLPQEYKQILQEQVEFYKTLEETKKQEFENRVQSFLSRVRITGINTTVEDTDRVLIAASAVIPIFSFPGWEYVNLNEVLLYPDAFGDEFEQEGQHRNTLGMVGNGAMNNVMLLSQHELRQAFINKTGKTNLAIHEFVHLVDKMDGSVDGVPEFILERKYLWSH